ncbi:MAG: HNH endonuclease [Terrestrivirus sp.]|uniref:HNH endonuclease n=1 Tax=Terrestrivirus sp. TaxID=2487775 RepID=A0A3G4ZTH2_9VIRU|nr:MAG: HNH endonuclease [Terrestrivirus sp.]
MTEIWKSVVEFPDYECSNLGHIKNIKTNKLLKLIPRNTGYVYVTLKNEKSVKSFFVHRIIALTWIENPENKSTVDHINRIRSDNRVENLRWATNIEQAKNQTKPLLINSARGVWKCNSITKEKIKLFRSNTDAAKNIFQNITDIKKVAINIGEAARNGTRAYEYYWKYDDAEIENKDDEIWKNIEETSYKVSNYGRIIGKRNNILKCWLCSEGYICFGLGKKSKRVHIMVANAFLEKKPNATIVNHKDGNKSNNHIDNLEWVTVLENNVHAIETGLRKSIRKIAQYDSENKLIKIYNSATDAGKALNVDHSTILNVCNNKHKSKFDYNLKFYKDTGNESMDTINNLKSIDIKENNDIIINKSKISVKKIAQYDSDGKLIKIYKSSREAAKALNNDSTCILRICKGINKSKFGYKLKFYEEAESKSNNIDDKLKSNKIDDNEVTIDKLKWSIKKIAQYDSNNKIIKIYRSAREAGKELNIDNSTILRICKGIYKSKAGYNLKFYQENDIPITE